MVNPISGPMETHLNRSISAFKKAPPPTLKYSVVPLPRGNRKTGDSRRPRSNGEARLVQMKSRQLIQTSFETDTLTVYPFAKKLVVYRHSNVSE